MKSAKGTIGSSKCAVPTKRRSVLRKQRDGAVLVAVLASLVIVIALVGSAIRSTLQGRRQCKLELQMQQAEVLLQAGMDRIASADVAKADWQTWDARLALPEFDIAEVRYESLASEGAVVRCTARLGLSTSPELAVQISRDLKLTQPTNENGGNK